MITPRCTRWLQAGGCVFMLIAALAGCRPSLDPEQYGKVIRKLPKIAGAERPYPLPQLEAAPEPADEPTK